jgi:hypothetical protein
MAAALFSQPACYAGAAALPTNLRLIVTPDSAEQTVYNRDTDRCDPEDSPDSPMRAFRDYANNVHLIAPYEVNRELIGPDLEHLKHSCLVALRGGYADDPSQYDDRKWLTAFSTTDGKHIDALVHEEFNGHRRPALCPSCRYQSCWYNAITYAVSDDGGYSFRQQPAPADLVATLPYRYRPDIGHPTGYLQPTNIVERDGYFYFMFLATAYGEQHRGICVARTRTIGDPHSWRAWDGSGFNVAFVDPYVSPAPDPAAHLCQPVNGKLFGIGSLSLDTQKGLFILVTPIWKDDRTKRLPPGPYVSTSLNLTHWSDPRPIILQDGTFFPDHPDRYGYFSLVDENRGDRTFSTISAKPYLLLYYVEFLDKNALYGRKLLLRRVQFR